MPDLRFLDVPSEVFDFAVTGLTACLLLEGSSFVGSFTVGFFAAVLAAVLFRVVVFFLAPVFLSAI